ncbi:hypothetical protein N0V85_005572 [Neurospora sp. IMI 360204]|nr:hypothetical protein N0V85_005572 [Neurospora sp. IMI 360204]
MPLPWLQDADPPERLPDETKWEDHDELTLWKQCKLRGLGGEVKKDGDALRILNALKRFQVKWLCGAEKVKSPDGTIRFPPDLVEEKAFESVIRFTKTHTLQIIRVKSFPSEVVIELSDATVRIANYKECNYLDLYVLRCPSRLQLSRYLLTAELPEYFANAPPAFKPQKFSKDQNLNDPISDKDCQLCFKEAKASRDILKCQACCRVAHQQCHDVYRTRKAACEGNTGCPLCCPQCPWNPSNPEVKAELVPMEVKREPGIPRDRPPTADDAVSSATKQKLRKLKQEVRKLRCQLRRKPASRVMSSLRYERLAGKIGRKGAKYRRNKLVMAVKNALKSEDAHTKDEDKAAVFKEEMESPVKIVKIEKRRKVKSEPVVISLL